MSFKFKIRQEPSFGDSWDGCLPFSKYDDHCFHGDWWHVPARNARFQKPDLRRKHCFYDRCKLMWHYHGTRLKAYLVCSKLTETNLAPEFQ